MLTAEQLEKLPLICDISNEEYHNSPGISNSGINLLLDCPLKYWDKYINPDRPPKEETESMRMGNMVHCFLLEPYEFKNRYIVMPKISRSGKKWEAYLEEACGKIIIWEEEQETLYRIADAISNHKDARHLIKPKGVAEKSIFWRDEETGVICRSRPDFIMPEYIVDIKTTRCASREGCRKSMEDYGYYRQAAMALDACEAVYKVKHENFTNLFIEPVRPYIVSPFIVSDKALKRGREEYKLGLKIYKQCTERNYWPQYVEEIEEIDLSAWTLNKSLRGEQYVNS